MTSHTGILGIGRYLPARIVTNDEIAATAQTSAAWIKWNIGVEERRFSNDSESQCVMGAVAAREALRHAGIDASQIDVILVTTNVPDYPIPSTACLIQHELKAHNATATDLITACAGFPMVTAMADAYIKSGLARHVLVIATERLSRLTDPCERTIYSILGDGAAALVFGKVTAGGVLGTYCRTVGEHWDAIHIPVGGTLARPSAQALRDMQHVIKMDGRKIKQLVERYFPIAAHGALRQAGLGIDDIDWLVPHQANLKLIHAGAQAIGVDAAKVVTNIERYGNTSSASIPIALYDLIHDGRLRSGDQLLMPAFGAGFSYGAVVYRWN